MLQLQKNIQPFKIYVVNSSDGIKKMDLATKCRYNAPLVFIVCGDKDKACKKNKGTTLEMDSSIIATHMMLEATNVWLNIWIEYFDENILRDLYDIPSNLEPFCLIHVWYKSKLCPLTPFHKVRKKINDLVEYR